VKTILSVVGARPNFMKLAPVDRVLRERPDARHIIVHTGQHYDVVMSEAFFKDLGIPEPHHNLGVGSGSHAQQTAAITQRFEPIAIAERPDLVLVYGDVNSTVAAALVAAKLSSEVGHVEAGLRSGDWTMPEEINRVVTDRLSQLLFTPSPDADENLRAEGVASDRIHFVGNVMIDSLLHVLQRALEMSAPDLHGVGPRQYALVTLHRPSNVDDPATLSELLGALDELSRKGPVLFPVHLRTRQKMDDFGLAHQRRNDVRLMEPVRYVEMLSLIAGAALVITDSGGLQEETCYLGIPCLTARPNTERPVTIRSGTNRLVASRRAELVPAALEAWGQLSHPLTLNFGMAIRPVASPTYCAHELIERRYDRPTIRRTFLSWRAMHFLALPLWHFSGESSVSRLRMGER
jgi:UDP-N-acetylglucosamine 2-epimerase (non-hydrolysing)